MARNCNISADNGPVQVTLIVNNALISGADFKIYEFSSGTVNETFKLNTDTSGTASYTVTLSASTLIGQVLSWQILTCAPVVTNSGIVKVQISQNGLLCATTPEASYTLTSVPACSADQSVPVQGGLLFN